MPIYDMYPYSNLHELNLDFIIKLCEEFKDGVEGFEEEIAAAETRLQAEITALSDRIHTLENVYAGGPGTPVWVYGGIARQCDTTIDVSIRGIAAKAEKLNYPRTIALTGDVEGSVSTDLSGNVEIETTVVGGGGGGSQEEVFFDGDVVFHDSDETTSWGTIIAPSGALQANRLYTVIYDGVEYIHKLTTYDKGVVIEEAPQGILSYTIMDRGMIIPKVVDGTTKHLKIVKENYDLYYSGDPSTSLTPQDNKYVGIIDSNLPLELKTGDYVVIVDGTILELTGEKDITTDGIVVSESNSEQFTITFSESLSNTYTDYREYSVESATSPMDLKIFGPKQTGEMKFVKFYDISGAGTTLTFSNNVVAGSILVLNNTDYVLQDSHDAAFCPIGKTYMGCSIPGTMAAIIQNDDNMGLMAMFAAPNISEQTMQIPIKDFKIYYTNNEYDDLYHAASSSQS